MSTWRYDCYCRAAWIDPREVRHIILGTADGVERNGRIEESVDAGKTWRAASTSAALAVPWPRRMVERFEQHGDELFAVLSDGEVWVSRLDPPGWRRLLPEVRGVAALAWLA